MVTDIITTDRVVADSDKELSICLRANGFSFSVATADRLLLTVGQVQTDTPPTATTLAQLLPQTVCPDGAALDYKKMRLIIPAWQSVWIPSHLYNPALDRQYLATVTHLPDGTSPFRVLSPVLDSYLVFTAPSDTVMALKIALPGIDVVGHHAVLVEAALRDAGNNHPTILLHVRQRAADIEALYNGRLLLSSTFAANNTDEVLYHTLNVMKRLHLETPDMELSICGLVDRPFFALLQHFFPNVSLHTGTPFTYLNPEFQTLPTYRHTLILT